MSADRPIRLFFLWHFHQPWYAELGGGPARLPWVRLHALKDYADLPALLSAEPRVPHVANLVPALLDQLELLTNGGTDAFLEIARMPVAEWDGATVDFVLDNFFSVHPRVLRQLPRYADLKRRREAAPGGARSAFSRQDLRDIVVFFHLAWSGRTLSKDPLLKRLRRRGHRFTEDDRRALLDRQSAFLCDVVPAWRTAFASGVLEAATSPYHHPILPLLVDGASAREAAPGMVLPAPRFARPEDAAAQIALGRSCFARHFGFVPAGMWPPEGSISEASLALMHSIGVAWTASDEDVLLGSLPRSGSGPGDRVRLVFRPYRLASGLSPVLFFRDRTLSDRIGFTYATWPAEDAAADFVSRLLALKEAGGDDELVVPVILDGENAWESYPENGEPFLRALGGALAREARIEVTTPSRLLRDVAPARLDRLVAGSWIDASFATWIGAPSKNRAWELLTRARTNLSTEIAGAADVPPKDFVARAEGAEAAKAALLAAEASDWFWWFGDDHTSVQDPLFDALFRSHLATAYRALGRDVPEELERPVEIGKKAAPLLEVRAISPVIDGAWPDYFEWMGAGRVSGQPHGAMNRSAGLLKEVLFAAAPGGESLYVRLDPATPPSSRLYGLTLRLRIESNGSEGAAFDIPIEPGVVEKEGVLLGVGRIVEMRAPLHPSASRTGPFGFRVTLLDAAGRELETIPQEGWIRFRTRTGDWSA